MTKLLIALAAVSVLATAIPAKAGSNCRTTCRHVGNQQVCDTFCY
jgi:hypothetical protein